MWEESIILSIVSGAAKYVLTYFPSWKALKNFNSCLAWERGAHWNAKTQTKHRARHYLRNNISQVLLKAKAAEKVVWRGPVLKEVLDNSIWELLFGCNFSTADLTHSIAKNWKLGPSENYSSLLKDLSCINSIKNNTNRNWHPLPPRFQVKFLTTLAWFVLLLFYLAKSQSFKRRV